jgi:hypothetical protein
MRSFEKSSIGKLSNVYKHMQVVYLLFRSSRRHHLARVVIWAEVALVYVEVHPCLCTSSLSLDYLRCDWGKEGSCPLDLQEPLPGIFRSPPSPCYAWETQCRSSFLLLLRSKFCCSVVGFTQLQHVKTLLWPFWPYSRQDGCRSVQAVPNLFVLP